MSWETVKLGTTAITSSGGTPSRTNSSYWNGKIPWIKSGQLKDKIILECDEYITELGLKHSSASIVPSGTLLLALYGATAGKLAFSNIEAATNQAICAIMPDEARMDKKYLFYFLLSIRTKILNDATGGAQPNISQAYVKHLDIPLPPLAIQKQIADILDKADALRKKDQQLLQKYDELAQAIFIDMFGDPVRNEKGWEVKKLGELCQMRRGASPRPINKYIGKDVPWIKIGDATKGNDIYITETKVHITNEGSQNSVLLNEGSLIFANCGVSLGFARILKIKGCIHDGWLSFEINDKEKLDDIFLLKLINSITPYLLGLAPGGTQPNLNTGIMKDLDIILPPLQMQLRFKKIITNIVALKEKQQSLKVNSSDLFDSIIKNKIED